MARTILIKFVKFYLKKILIIYTSINNQNNNSVSATKNNFILNSESVL